MGAVPLAASRSIHVHGRDERVFIGTIITQGGDGRDERVFIGTIITQGGGTGFDGCITQPSFNVEGQTSGIYCADHKLPDMIVNSKRCEFDRGRGRRTRTRTRTCICTRTTTRIRIMAFHVVKVYVMCVCRGNMWAVKVIDQGEGKRKKKKEAKRL